MKNRSIALLLIIVMLSCALAGCSGEGNSGSKDPSKEIWKSGGIAYLTEDGKMMLLTDLSGNGEAVCLSESSAVFYAADRCFTNASAGKEDSLSAMFSKDGTKLYYFTDLSSNTGNLYVADVRDTSKLPSRLTSDAYCRTYIRDDGLVYMASKNGDMFLYLDGEMIGELDNGRMWQQAWLTDDGKGVVFLSDNSTIEHVRLSDQKKTVLSDDFDSFWYDGGNTVYFSCSEKIWRVDLNGKKEQVIEKFYSVEKMVGEKLYYTLQFCKEIELQMETVEEISYELWCFDGKKSVKICDDYYADEEYSREDGYYIDFSEYDYDDFDKEDISELYFEYVRTEEFVKKYWEKFVLKDFCEDTFGRSGNIDTAEELCEFFKDEDSFYSVYEEYDEYLRSWDSYEYLFGLIRKPYFYGDEKIVVYTSAERNEIETKDEEDYPTTASYYFRKSTLLSLLDGSASYTLANGKSGEIEGVNAGDFFGIMGDDMMVFLTSDKDILVYDISEDAFVFEKTRCTHVTIEGNNLYYYDVVDELFCFDGKEERVLAEDAKCNAPSSWIYDDGLIIALCNADSDDGTLKLFRNGEGEWIADDVSYYQRISDKEIVYISDGMLYIHTIGGESISLADDVSSVYGAYYGGVLVGR
ncbi:MAG: hypothetical protein E7665_09900 [Ruminococcaceae bacterium]|nr:hypothetical protein [Oscillospiraceae bacterium]